MKSPYIVFIGDSLTEYFDWSRRFPRCRVDNLGVSGETAEGLLERLQRISASVHDPDFLFVMTGINSVATGDLDFLEALRMFLESLVAGYGSRTVVLQSVLPVDLPWLENDVIRGVNRRLRGLASELRVEYLDLYGSFIGDGELPVSGLLLDDGVHLSAQGYALWSALIENFLCARGVL